MPKVLPGSSWQVSRFPWVGLVYSSLWLSGLQRSDSAGNRPVSAGSAPGVRAVCVEGLALTVTCIPLTALDPGGVGWTRQD